MKYYQAVYQADSHGFNITYSKNIWRTEEEALEYLDEMNKLMPGYIYSSWVEILFVDDGQ